MVVGERAKGSKLRFHRNAANIFYNLLASYVTRFKVKDLTSGFPRSVSARCLTLHRPFAQYVLLSHYTDPGVLALGSNG